MRLFIGIPLATSASQEVAALLTHARSTLREPQTEQLRWSAPEAWHITLQFLGKTTPEQYACVIEHLRDVHHPPVPVELSGVATFERTGVFFAGVQLSPELLTLHQAIVAATYPCGFRTEDRPYRPHVTLARRRRSTTSLEWRAVTSGAHPPLRSSFTADSFVLYESIPSPEGSRYVQRAVRVKKKRVSVTLVRYLRVRIFFAHSGLIVCRARPSASASAGTSSVIVEPAAM